MAKVSLSSVLTAALAVAWYTVAVGLVLATCLAVVAVFHDFGPGWEIDLPVSFSVDAGALHVSAPSIGVETGYIHDVRGSLVFPAPAAASLLMPVLSAVVIMLAITLWALSQLRAVFRTLRDGLPFVPANATRIRRIGVVVIIGEFARAAFVFGANSYAMKHFSATGLHFDARPDFNTFMVIHGLIIVAIAEVFRVGTRLHEDQSLTI